jgi:hypothetical protein
MSWGFKLLAMLTMISGGNSTSIIEYEDESEKQKKIATRDDRYLKTILIGHTHSKNKQTEFWTLSLHRNIVLPPARVISSVDNIKQVLDGVYVLIYLPSSIGTLMIGFNKSTFQF